MGLQHHDDSGAMGWEHGTSRLTATVGSMNDVVRSGNSSGLGVTFPTHVLSGMLLNPAIVPSERRIKGHERDVATFTDSTGGRP